MPKRANVQVSTETFYSLFNQENKLTLPLFQREYTWDQDNWTKIWDDIEKTISTHAVEHFLGQIVLGRYKTITHSPKSLIKNFYHIIDGQQRITTATLFLCALRDEASANGNKEIANEIQRYVVTVSGDPNYDDDIIVTLSYLDKEFFKNFVQFRLEDSRRKGESAYKKKLASGEIQPSNELIWGAYNFFKDKTRERITAFNDTQKADYFTRLKDCFLRDFFFIEVRLPNIDEGSQIFETMNAWGERLEVIDLVKNLVFMKRQSQGIASAKLESEIIEWNDSIAKLRNIDLSRFLRHYWLSKYDDKVDPVKIENLYSHFNKKAEAEKGFINQLLAEIGDYVDIYVTLNQPESYIPFDGKSQTKRRVVDALVGFDAMNASRAFPLLMSTLRNLPEYFPRICRLIEILVFRYSLICNLDAKRLEGIFNEVAVAFEEADKTSKSEIADLVNNEIKKLKNEIPGREQLENSFKFKSRWTSKAAKYVLSRIEMSKGTGEKTLNSQRISVEHIFPKSPSRECKEEAGKDLEILMSKTNFIGNLTLILGKWNQRMSNRKFSFKRDTYYKKSELKITRELSRLDSWGSKELEQRMKDFSEKCTNLWDPKLI